MHKGKDAFKMRLRAAMTELREAKKHATGNEEMNMLDDLMHTLSRRVRATSDLEIPVPLTRKTK